MKCSHACNVHEFRQFRRFVNFSCTRIVSQLTSLNKSVKNGCDFLKNCFYGAWALRLGSQLAFDTLTGSVHVLGSGGGPVSAGQLTGGGKAQLPPPDSQT